MGIWERVGAVVAESVVDEVGEVLGDVEVGQLDPAEVRRGADDERGQLLGHYRTGMGPNTAA